MATRKEVAERAGVSPAVVSYVLNQSNYVSEEKTEAVLKAVRELNYSPNYMAKSLKTSQSYNFALVCDDIRSELFAEVAYHMEQYAYRHGYNTFLCNSRPDDRFLEMLINRQMDGIFVATNIFTGEQLNRLAASGTRIVFYQTREYPGLDPAIKPIFIDYRNAMRILMEHLFEMGHRSIAYMPPYLSQITSLDSEDYRLRGYCDALAGRRIKPTSKNVCFTNQEYEAMLEFAAGLMRRPAANRPTAIVAGNDYLAIKVLNYLRGMGVTVPDDVALAGLDDTASSFNASPQLTTMGFSKRDIARCVVESLLEGKVRFDASPVHFHARLITRASTQRPV